MVRFYKIEELWIYASLRQTDEVARLTDGLNVCCSEFIYSQTYYHENVEMKIVSEIKASVKYLVFYDCYPLRVQPVWQPEYLTWDLILQIKHIFRYLKELYTFEYLTWYLTLQIEHIFGYLKELYTFRKKDLNEL